MSISTFEQIRGLESGSEFRRSYSTGQFRKEKHLSLNTVSHMFQQIYSEESQEGRKILSELKAENKSKQEFWNQLKLSKYFNSSKEFTSCLTALATTLLKKNPETHECYRKEPEFVLLKNDNTFIWKKKETGVFSKGATNRTKEAAKKTFSEIFEILRATIADRIILFFGDESFSSVKAISQDEYESKGLQVRPIDIIRYLLEIDVIKKILNKNQLMRNEVMEFFIDTMFWKQVSDVEKLAEFLDKDFEVQYILNYLTYFLAKDQIKRVNQLLLQDSKLDGLNEKEVVGLINFLNASSYTKSWPIEERKNMISKIINEPETVFGYNEKSLYKYNDYFQEVWQRIENYQKKIKEFMTNPHSHIKGKEIKNFYKEHQYSDMSRVVMHKESRLFEFVKSSFPTMIKDLAKRVIRILGEFDGKYEGKSIMSKEQADLYHLKLNKIMEGKVMWEELMIFLMELRIMTAKVSIVEQKLKETKRRLENK